MLWVVAKVFLKCFRMHFCFILCCILYYIVSNCELVRWWGFFTDSICRLHCYASRWQQINVDTSESLINSFNQFIQKHWFILKKSLWVNHWIIHSTTRGVTVMRQQGRETCRSICMLYSKTWSQKRQRVKQWQTGISWARHKSSPVNRWGRSAANVIQGGKTKRDNPGTQQ